MAREGTPFPFEGPVAPELLIDRESELLELGRYAADRVAVRLAAPRRYGKTSIALAHASALSAAGWHTAHVDFSRVTDIADAARRVARGYGQLDAGWLRSHLAALLSRLGVTLGVAGASVALRPNAPSANDAQTVLERLLDLPAELHRRDGRSTLVVFDEFQDLLVARDNLDGLLRSHIQYHGDAAAYLYAGSEPSLMARLFEDGERPLFGQAQPMTLTPLPLEATVTALSERLEAEGLSGGEALGELVVFTAGHPQRTMLCAYLLSRALADGARADAQTAQEVIALALERSLSALEALWGGLDRAERVVAGALADGQGATSRSVAAEHGLSRNALADAAARLAAAGHVQQRGRARTLTDPLLAEWLRRR